MCYLEGKVTFPTQNVVEARGRLLHDHAQHCQSLHAGIFSKTAASGVNIRNYENTPWSEFCKTDGQHILSTKKVESPKGFPDCLNIILCSHGFVNESKQVSKQNMWNYLK